MKSVNSVILKPSINRTVMRVERFEKGGFMMLFLILCVVFIAFVSREVWQMFRTKDSENVQVNHMLGVSGILLLGIGFWVF